jgi:hypothetical protein
MEQVGPIINSRKIRSIVENRVGHIQPIANGIKTSNLSIDTAMRVTALMTVTVIFSGALGWSGKAKVVTL